jgi:hypothetical protein
MFYNTGPQAGEQTRDLLIYVRLSYLTLPLSYSGYPTSLKTLTETTTLAYFALPSVTKKKTL